MTKGKIFIVASIFVFLEFAYAQDQSQRFNNALGSKVEFESSSEKTRASAKIKLSEDPIHQFFVNFTGTIGEETKTGTFADLDGLSKGAKVELEYTFVDFADERTHPLYLQKEWDQLDAIVRKLGAERDLAISSQDGATNPARRVKCKATPNCKSKMDAYDKALKDLNDFKRSNKKVLNPLNQQVEFPFEYSFSIAANRSDFDVLDIETLKSKSQDETGMSAKASIKSYFGRLTRWKVGVEIQRAFEQGGQTKEYCELVDEQSNRFVCVNGNVSSVQRVNNHNLSFQIGGYTKNALLKGWDIQLTHNFKNDKTGLSVPLYFYESEKGEVNAGLKFDFIYNEDAGEDSAQALLFFGTALDIF
jgi:hypothetical protein